MKYSGVWVTSAAYLGVYTLVDGLAKHIGARHRISIEDAATDAIAALVKSDVVYFRVGVEPTNKRHTRVYLATTQAEAERGYARGETTTFETDCVAGAAHSTLVGLLGLVVQ